MPWPHVGPTNPQSHCCDEELAECLGLLICDADAEILPCGSEGQCTGDMVIVPALKLELGKLLDGGSHTVE